MALMKRIKLKGQNDPSQNIAAWENKLLPLKRSSLHLLYLLDGGYMIDARNWGIYECHFTS